MSTALTRSEPEETALQSANGLGSGGMFDGIAERYDLLNRLTSFGLDQRWRARLVESVAPALEGPQAVGRVLDLATGTGDVALALAKRYPQARVVGLDPSPGMLGCGREKFAGRVAVVQGDGQHLPLPDDVFDAITIAFGIRNYPNRALGVREMVRVTRPGGRVSILELSEPRGLLGPLARIHVHHVVPAVGALLSGAGAYGYLARSIADFPPAEVFSALLEAAGLVDVRATPLTFGAVHLYTGRVPTQEAT